MILYVIEQIWILILFLMLSILLITQLVNAFVCKKSTFYAYIRAALFLCCLLIVSYFYAKSFLFGLNAFLLCSSLIYVGHIDKHYEQSPYFLCGLPFGLFIMQNIFFITIWFSFLILLIGKTPHLAIFLQNEIEIQNMTRAITLGTNTETGLPFFELKKQLAEMHFKAHADIAKFTKKLNYQGLNMSDPTTRMKTFSAAARLDAHLLDHGVNGIQRGIQEMVFVEKRDLETINFINTNKNLLVNAHETMKQKLIFPTGIPKQLEAYYYDVCTHEWKFKFSTLKANPSNPPEEQVHNFLVDWNMQQYILQSLTKKNASALQITKLIFADESDLGLSVSLPRGLRNYHEGFARDYSNPEVLQLRIGPMKPGETNVLNIIIEQKGINVDLIKKAENGPADFALPNDEIICSKEATVFPSLREACLNGPEDKIEGQLKAIYGKKGTPIWQDIKRFDSLPNLQKSEFRIDLTQIYLCTQHYFQTPEDLFSFMEKIMPTQTKELILTKNLNVHFTIKDQEGSITKKIIVK